MIFLLKLVQPKHAFLFVLGLAFLASGINLFGPKPSTEQYLADFSAITEKSLPEKETEQTFRSRSEIKTTNPSADPEKEENLISFLEGSWAPLPSSSGDLSEEEETQNTEEKEQQGAFFSEDNSKSEGASEKETPKNAPIIPQKKETASIAPVLLGQEEPKQEKDAQEEKPIVSSFSDGLFSAIGTYETEKGEESIGVKIRLTNGMIEEMEIIPLAGDAQNGKEQETFANQIPKMLVGENISQLPEISGYGNSSNILDGFQEALVSIVEKASEKE